MPFTDAGFSMKKIANMLRMSPTALKWIAQSRGWHVREFTALDDGQVDNIMRQALTNFSNMGVYFIPFAHQLLCLLPGLISINFDCECILKQCFLEVIHPYSDFMLEWLYSPIILCYILYHGCWLKLSTCTNC